MKKADAIICKHCNSNEKEIFEIAFTKADGLLQFVCEIEDHTEDDGLPIHSDHVFESQPEIEFFRHIRENFVARRVRDPEGWNLRFYDIDEQPEGFGF